MASPQPQVETPVSLQDNTICVHMLTYDGEFTEPVIRAIAPHVNRVMIWIDIRSSDGYKEKIMKMGHEFHNLDIGGFDVKEPKEDLVLARNMMIRMTGEKWIWIVDDDEYYQEDIIEKIKQSLSEDDIGYAMQFWAIWDEEHCHMRTSNKFAPRIFRNTGRLEWKGQFGEEKIYNGEENLWKIGNLKVRFLPFRYIHFTFVKNQKWRKEMKKERRVRRTGGNGRLGKLPKEVKKEVIYVLKNYKK